MAEAKTPDDILKELKTKKKIEPNSSFKIIYDSNSETLEPIYFWLLDFISETFRVKVEKLVDNFTATPGSEDFLRNMEKTQRMQGEASNIYGTVNTVVKSIINILYDLKEFEVRLADYEKYRSKNKTESQAGLLTLKQIWMDQVDIKKGRGSINMMAQDLNFVTLRDAFMFADSLDAVEKTDLNERVKRVLLARLEEFFEWKDRSEAELKKRFNIEKSYLRTQVNALKMYSRWAKPYLKAAEDARMKEQGISNSDLVKAFNTILFQLTLFAKKEVDPASEADAKNIPREFRKIKFKRKYYWCLLVDFTFRGIPSRVGQNYAFGGKVEVNLRSYALNSEELDVFYKEIEDSDVSDVLNMIEGMTTESLEEMKKDIDKYLSGEEEKEKKKKELEEENINPFTALAGKGTFWGKDEKGGKAEEKEEEAKKNKDKKIEMLKKNGIKADNYAEKVLRNFAAFTAKGNCFKVYDIYKKGHGMASVPFDRDWKLSNVVNVGFVDLFKG